MSATRVRLDDVSKSFFGTFANKAIDLELKAGEVHALLGENGAGKTTLCSILAGMYRPDYGRIAVDGVERHFRSPADALAAGIGMVYQHFRLVPNFTVTENILLGQPTTARVLNRSATHKAVQELSRRYGIVVDPAAKVGSLTVGEQQRVEILKLLHRGVKVLILDEPTAVLTAQETDALFAAMRALAAEGRALVFISHKLNEVLAISTTVSVLRDGRRVATVAASESDERTLARLMVDRSEDIAEVESGTGTAAGRPAAPAAPASVPGRLEVRDLVVLDERGRAAVRELTLSVPAGQITGLVGVSGNGQRELAEAIAGVRPCEGGSIVVDGIDLTRASVRTRVRNGVAFIPEDRMSMGVAAGLSLEDNLLLRSYCQPPVSRAGILFRQRAVSGHGEIVERYGIRGARAGFPIRILSGGNVQRAILGRELAGDPGVIVAASPCRGLDVHATRAVRDILLARRDDACSVLLISEDLDELRALSDRLLVIYEGRIVAELAAGEATPEQLGLLMAGASA